MSKPWCKNKSSPYCKGVTDQQVVNIASNKGWYQRQKDNVEDALYRLSNDIKYIYLSGHGHEFKKYYVSNGLKHLILTYGSLDNKLIS